MLFFGFTGSNVSPKYFLSTTSICFNQVIRGLSRGSPGYRLTSYNFFTVLQLIKSNFIILYGLFIERKKLYIIVFSFFLSLIYSFFLPSWPKRFNQMKLLSYSKQKMLNGMIHQTNIPLALEESFAFKYRYQGTSWTYRYFLDLYVPLGHLGTSWTFRYLLDTLTVQVPIGPLGSSWTNKYVPL